MPKVTGKKSLSKKDKKKLQTINLDINNEVDPSAKDEYIAWCDFTTIKNGKHATVKKGDKVSAREIPQIWIDQAVSQKFLILRKDFDNLSGEEKKRRGYN